jgi:curved DNA-binding protein CbpA
LSIQQAYEVLKDKNKRAIYDSQFVTNPSQRYRDQQMGYTFSSEEELNEFIKRYENMYTWKDTSSEPFYGDSESAKKRYQEARQRMEQILRDQEDAERRRQAFQPIFFWILTGFFAAIFLVNVYVQVKLAERKNNRYSPVDENGNPIYDLGTTAAKAHRWDYLVSQSEKRRQIYELLGSQADDSEHNALSVANSAAHPAAASRIIVHK